MTAKNQERFANANLNDLAARNQNRLATPTQRRLAATAQITIQLPHVMKTIVALVDFSSVTPKVVDQVLELARCCGGGEIILVHVVPPMPIVMDYAPAFASEVEETEARHAGLQALEDSAKERHAEVSTRLFNGPIVETLLAHLPELNPDLVVMGSHGHGALYHLIVGSVAQGIIKDAVWPVMIVPKVPVKARESDASSCEEKAEGEAAPTVVGALAGAMMPP